MNLIWFVGYCVVIHSQMTQNIPPVVVVDYYQVESKRKFGTARFRACCSKYRPCFGIDEEANQNQLQLPADPADSQPIHMYSF